MSHNEEFAVRRVFSPLFFVRHHSAGLGVGEKKSAITSWQDFQEVVVQQHQTGEDGKVNMTNRKRFHTLIVSLSALWRIHILHLSLLPIPTSLQHTKVPLFL